MPMPRVYHPFVHEHLRIFTNLRRTRNSEYLQISMNETSVAITNQWETLACHNDVIQHHPMGWFAGQRGEGGFGANLTHPPTHIRKVLRKKMELEADSGHTTLFFLDL